MVRGRTNMFPRDLLLRSLLTSAGRRALWTFATRMAAAQILGRKALHEGQLLRDIAWSRAHLLIVDAWTKQTRYPQEWLASYERQFMRFPVPTCF